MFLTSLLGLIFDNFFPNWHNFSQAIYLLFILVSYMVASIKTLKFISATVYEIKRGNQYSKKEKYPYSEDINTQ